MGKLPILSAIKQFFMPPVFPNNEAKNRLGKIIYVLVVATVAFIVLGLIAVIFLFAEKTINTIILLTLMGILLAINLLIRRSHLRLGGFLYIFTLWGLATALLYTGSGTSSPELSLYIALTVIASIVLGARWAVSLAVLSSIVVLGVALLEINDHPFPRIFTEAPLVRWFDFSILLFFTFTPVYLILAGLSEALHRVQQENEQRKKAEQAIRASEEYFRALIENAQDIITILNTDGTIRFESPAVERILGYKPEELVGQNVFDFVHPDDHQTVLEVFQQSLQDASNPQRVELRFKHHDGSWRHFEAIGKNLLHNPAVQGVVVNSRDVTERKQLEEQFLQAQKMEVIGRLAGGIAHDFNNILVPIIGYTELAMMQLSPNDKLYADMKQVREAAERAVSLTRQILASSRKQVLEMQVLDLNAVVADFEKMIQRLIKEDIELQTILDSALYRVKADKGQIEQVLLNLVVNARDAMPQGGRLTIETANVYLDEAYIKKHVGVYPLGHYAMLVVSDTGYGMDAETQQQIFEPFFTTKKQGEGTGLGLATVFGIIKQHGGNIWVYSEPGKGATFKIYLPQATGTIQTPDTIATEPALLYGTETILVIEDEEMVRKLVGETLTAHGYKVVEAQDVNDALQRVSEGKEIIHLLLTDVIMPEMNGRELYKNVVAIDPTIKVLYMSGYTDNVIVYHGILDEGVNFLQKPFTVRSLLQKVRQALS